LHDDKNERDMKNPASQVFRDHSTAFLEFAKQLGLSFVSRARVTMSKGESDDGNPFAKGRKDLRV
jgi:phage terminase small subunit